ncbi:MAG: UvrD-helicase domain-containing protein, partial [Gemmatimonadales bacterium]
MRVPDSFIPANGPNLVEASAGTGKTTWMVRTAVRLLLKEPGMPGVNSADRLLAVTFTRAATAELKERIRGALHEVKRIRDGQVPRPGSEWMQKMLDTGGSQMSAQLDVTLASLDRLAVTTIHGFCKGALEEFALDCGVPVGLQFIEQDRQYRDEAISDEWRTLTWQSGPVSDFVLGERMNGATTRWSPTTLEAAARIVRQGIGAERPSRVDRLAELATVRTTLDSILEHWDEARLRKFHSQIKWNKGGITSDDVDALCTAIGKLRAGEEPVVLDIRRWSRSAVESVANKSNKINKELIPGERFLDACEVVHSAYDNAASLIWQDAVLSIAERMERGMERDRVAGFDEMIGYLQRAITDEHNGERLRGVLASRYDAVLVDEFQDTDWPQWSIFSGTFGIKPLVLVGDPKQSIYGFRGADITAYRAARETAAGKGDNRVFSLDRNYRSDRKLVDATEILFSQTITPFAVEQSVLAFEHVDAERNESSLTDGDLRPLVMVDLERGRADEQEKKITLFIAAEVARLLRDPAVVYQDPSDKKPRRLKPSDIAILVSANRQAVPLLDALRSYRVPAVSGATGDIAESAMWQDVLLLIGAIEDPSDPRVVRRALSTSIGGKSARELAALESNGD